MFEDQQNKQEPINDNKVVTPPEIKPAPISPENNSEQKMEMNLNNGLIKKIILIIIGVLLVGGLVYGGYWGYNNLIKEETVEESGILDQTMAAMAGMKTTEFEIWTETTKANSNIISGNKSIQAITDFLGDKMMISFSGYIDNTLDQNQKVLVDLDIESSNGNAKGTFISVDNNSYFKMTELPGTLSNILNSSGLNNEWINYETDTDSSGEENVITAVITSLSMDLPQVLAVTDQSSSDTEYTITANVDMEKLNTSGNNESLGTLSGYTFELNIAKDTYYINKIEAKENGQTKIILSFSNFNMPVTINVPENYKSTEEMLEAIMGGLSFSNENNTEGVVTDNQENFEETEDIDSDNDGLTDREEEGWGTDPNVADTDGDGYSDYEEIMNGYDPLSPGSVRLIDYDYEYDY